MSASRARRSTVRVILTAILAFALMMIFGRIVFASWATDLLVRASASLCIYGDEAIEDFYMLLTMIVSIVLAAAIVVTGDRALARRHAVERD